NGNPSCGAAIPCGTPGDLTDAIVALDCDTGALVWSYTAIYCDSFDLDFGSSSVVLFDDGVHDLAGAGSKNGVFYAVDRNTGSLAWAADLNGLCSNGCDELFSAAGFAYGKLFLTPGTSFPSVAVALDPGNGNVLWSQPSQARGYCGPAIAGGMVFTGISNTIAALDQNTGAVLWSYGMGSPIWSNPAVVNGSLYVMSKHGRLTKFSLP